MAKPKPPIDPLGGGPYVLEGRIVTMDAQNTVIAKGRCYVKDSTLIAVGGTAASAPPGFSKAPKLVTHGTIYPGLIELHNHLAYNALRLWKVPKKYTNRDQWAGIAEYRKCISGPMQIIGKTVDVLPALIRYVEAKTLMGGCTTSQGIQLFSQAGIRRFYRGIVRNVELTDEAALPEANTRIADVDAATAAKFFERLKKQSCFLLHLSEGTDEKARKHFQALQIDADRWAIGPQLAGIHCAALSAADFAIYAQFGGAMIWSPFSNLLLYGETANVKAAKAAGVQIGLGSDWSPSGSKNLLGELKVAKAWNAVNNVFSDPEILALATRNAAAILKWDTLLGSLETNKRADLLVVDGTDKDPYTQLFEAREGDIGLVMINGAPRYGHSAWMEKLGAKKETRKVGSQAQAFNFVQETQDELVGKLSLKNAEEALAAALQNLPALAKELEKPKPAAPTLSLFPEPPTWELALDEIQHTEVGLRPRLPARNGKGRVGALPLQGPALQGLVSEPLSKIVEPLVIDPLTVVDDAEFLATVASEKNLTPELIAGLVALY